MEDIIIESPVSCKIFLKYKSKKNGYEMKEILLTQVLNYKITENKKPVYGFNKNRFQQVINGKRLLEGVIVLKKSIFESVEKAINLDSEENINEKEDIERKLNLIKGFIDDDNDKLNMIEQYKDDYERAYYRRKENLISKKSYNIFEKLPNGAKLIVLFNSTLSDNTFKVRLKEINKNKDSGMALEDLKELIEKSSEIVIEDINFTEKISEINISKTDIDEVYKFFGSLNNWEE